MALPRQCGGSNEISLREVEAIDHEDRHQHHMVGTGTSGSQRGVQVRHYLLGLSGGSWLLERIDDTQRKPAVTNIPTCNS